MRSLQLCYLLIPFIILSACQNDDSSENTSIDELALSDVEGSWFGSFDSEGLSAFEGELNYSGNVLITFLESGAYRLELESLTRDTFELIDEGTFTIQGATLRLTSSLCSSENFSCQLSERFSGKEIRLLEGGLQISSSAAGDTHFYSSYPE